MGGSTLRVVVVVGTRPEAIKMAPVYLNLRSIGENVVLIATAQHREMMDMMLEVFDMKPDYDLNVMRKNQSLNYIASAVLEKVEGVLMELDPDVVLVQGDTTTAMAVALASFHMGIKVGHVEAGLRSGNLRDPFPEEMNRRIIDVLAEYAFAPTRRAVNNLLNEGVERGRIHLVGNTVVDALDYVSRNYDLDSIAKTLVGEDPYMLVTLHRRENIGSKMKNVLKALRRFALDTGLKVVFPVHRNPRVRSRVYDVLGDLKNAVLMEPVNYVNFLALLKECVFVLTDSGGIQEEAPSFGKFVVVARETTERPELIESGWGILAGTDEEKVYSAMKRALEFEPKGRVNPFGDGMASKRIVDIILEGEYEPFEG